MVLDHDLQVLASMNGIDRTSFHAMWFGARSTGSRDQEIIQALAGAKQTRDRNTMCLRAMLLDAASRARVAACAVIQIEHENVLTFVKTLLDILVENSVAYGRAVQASVRLLDDPAPQDAKLAQHLEKIGPAKLRQLQLIQGGASCAAQPWRKDSRQVISAAIELALQGPVDFFYRPSLIIEGKREQSDLSQDRAGPFRDNLGLSAMLFYADPDVAEANEIQMSRDIALSEQSLTRLHADEGNSVPQVIHDTAIFVLLDATEQIRILQRQIEGTLTVFALKSLALAGEAHEPVEDIAANLPDLAFFESSDIGRPRRPVQTRHFTDDDIGRSPFSDNRFLATKPQPWIAATLERLLP